MHSGTDAADWPPVGVVVLNWHGRADTLQCLRSLAALTYPQRSVILVDNGCQEFSPDEVAALVPGAQYLRTDTNLGFAGGANLGMRAALARGAAYVWFLNHDAQPEPQALTELVAAARADATRGVVGPKIVQQRDPRRLDSIALRIDLWRGRIYLVGHDAVDQGQYDGLAEVDAVTGCAMLVSRVACERLGGFDERFFAYLEDADLCLRAHAAGFRVWAAPLARVLHNRAPATHGRQSVSSLRYTTRNHLLLMRRHSPCTGARRALLVGAVVALNLAYAVRAGDDVPARLRAVWRGVRDYARGAVGPVAE
ncbi:MAG: glycosyltransferase family 2 protein [Candidatus Binatia bacterium]